MDKRKLITILIAAGLCFTLLVTTAHAGDRQRYRWEGVALGILGATVVGTVLGAPYAHPAPVHFYWGAPPPHRPYWGRPRQHYRGNSHRPYAQHRPQRPQWHRPPRPHWKPYGHHQTRPDRPRRHGGNPGHWGGRNYSQRYR